MPLTKISWIKTAALLSVAVWAGPLALLSPKAHSQSNNLAYCFNVQASTNLYSSPSFGAVMPDRFASGDTAYATTNPPTTVWVNDGTIDGNSFVEVAIYDGLIAWVPRFPAGSNAPLLVDITDCPNPGPNAIGGPNSPGLPGNGGPVYCFAVTQSTNLYARPSFGAMTGDRYAAGDTALATANPPFSVWVDDGTADGNSFVAVEIYDGSTAWVPRFPAGSNAPILVDLPSSECGI